MNKVLKLIIIFTLLTGLAANSFGETLYGFSLWFNRIYEQYPNLDYGRDFNGVHFDIMLNNYPGSLPLGWYVKTSFGGSSSGLEWQGNDIKPLDFYSSSDIRLSIGPSYLFKTGNKLLFPISLGPILTNCRENGSYYIYDDDERTYNEDVYYSSAWRSSFYETFNLGFFMEAAFVINVVKRLTLISGLTMSIDFLKWERGYVQTNFRDLNNGKFNREKFIATNLGFFTGIGLRFEGTKKNEEEY